MDKLINVGKFNTQYNLILGTSFDEYDIYRDKGLIAHLLKRKHNTAIKHLDDISEIISDPDYIGKNPKQPNSIEFVKCYKRNMLLGVKVDLSKGYMYVATMHEITAAIIERYVNSGRLKEVDKNKLMNYNVYNKLDEPEQAPGALSNENLI